MWIAVCVATGVAGGRMADIEDRNPYVWGFATGAVAWFGGDLLGEWFWFAPVLALAACFAALWVMKARDGDGPGGRIVR
jgi:hypothetical protein